MAQNAIVIGQAETDTGATELQTETHPGTEVAEEHHFPPLDPTTFGSQVLWLAITFGALYVLMSRIALPRIGEILEVRRDRIEGDLAEADRLRQKTDQAIEAYEAELAEARSKAHAIAEETRQGVKAKNEESRTAAEASLAQKMSEAEARIEQTKAEALTNVDEIAAETAAAIVTRISGKVTLKDARSAVSRVVKG